MLVIIIIKCTIDLVYGKISKQEPYEKHKEILLENSFSLNKHEVGEKNTSLCFTINILQIGVHFQIF